VLKKRIRLDEIKIDGSTQMRESIDPDDVAELAEHYKAGKSIPAPVVFWDGSCSCYWPGDGHHRIAGRRAAGFDDIEVECHEGTKRDAVLYAAGANADHGVKRTNGDKRKAVATLLRDTVWGQWSDRAIADKCNVGHPLVASVRAQISTGSSSSHPQNSRRVSADGKSRPATQPTRGPQPEKVRCERCVRINAFRSDCPQCAAATANALKAFKPAPAPVPVNGAEDEPFPDEPIAVAGDEPFPEEPAREGAAILDKHTAKFEKCYDALLLAIEDRASIAGRNEVHKNCIARLWECRELYKRWVETET
jgi:hypothetical protein